MRVVVVWWVSEGCGTGVVGIEGGLSRMAVVG